MPELPEVETVMRGLSGVLVGRSFRHVEVRRAGLRFPFPPGFAQRLAGRRIEGMSRRAKYIFCSLDGGESLLVHLGMTGRFTVFRPYGGAVNLGEFYFEPGAGEAGHGPHDHAVFDLDDGIRVTYTDPRRFGIMDIVADAEKSRHKLLKDIGVEPLGNDFHAGYLAKSFAGKAAPLKAVLLDQRIVAGLGNIYVCEALHRSGLSPKRKAGTLVRRGLADPRIDTLVRNIRDVLSEAIAFGGSTLRDFAATDGASGRFQQRFDVYDREGQACRREGCGGTVRRIVQSGRSTFLCRSCQK